MDCEDARQGLSALVSGSIGLTDWALLEAHLKQCAECRQAEAHPRQLAAASQPVTRPRAVLGSLRKAMELARMGVTRSTALVVWRGALLMAAARDLTSRATVGATRAVGLAVGESADLMTRIRASLASAYERAAGTIASAWQAFRLGITRLVAEVAQLHASLASPLGSSVAAMANALEAVRLRITRSVERAVRFRPSVQAVGLVLALAFTLYALRGTDGPQQLARPPAPPRAGLALTRLEAAPVEPAQLEPAPPAPSVERQTVSAAPPRTDALRQAPSGAPPRVAALSPPDVPAYEPVRGVASSPPTRRSEPPVSATHVVGRLSAKNPGTAPRDFLALLTHVGGTELGRSQRVRFTAVEVLVPQSRYNEFTEGLARIGSWRLEAARFPLPDAVRMTIRVGE